MANHANLTDPELHEPKGIAAASDGDVYVANGAGSGTWSPAEGAVFPLTVGKWEDLRVPATSINLPGGIADADRDTDNGTLLFDAATDEYAVAVVQLPHSWQEGTSVYPHVHWAKTTSATGDVAWVMEYKAYKINEVGAGAWATLATVTTPVAGTPDTNQAEKHLISTFGELVMTGYEFSDILLIRIYRDANNAADTYGADARLLEFDIHYQIDSLGSDGEFA